jgi:tetratricopeptide (TPR) repeat protein
LTLTKLATDLKVPAMLRASALAGLTTDTSKGSLQAAMAALSDADAKVVSAALLRLDAEINRIGDRQRYAQSGDSNSELRPLVGALAKLFDHPSRRVRIEAARVFVTLDPRTRMTLTDAEQRVGFEKALGELKESLYIENDRAAYHMMLGGIHEMLGDLDRAKDDYRAAISVETNLAGARSNLAALLDADSDRMRQQIQQSQSSGGVTAGQLKSMLTQIQQISIQAARLRAEEHELLAKDIERSKDLADTHGLHYRFAMSSYLQGEMEAAEKHLLEAHRQQPDMPTYLLGLAAYYIQVGKPKEALKYIEPLVKLDPRHPGYQSLLDQAQSMEQN